MVIETQERAKTQSETSENGSAIRPMHADDHSNAHPAVQTPVEGRQGFLGKPVLIVLVAALVLAVIAGSRSATSPCERIQRRHRGISGISIEAILKESDMTVFKLVDAQTFARIVMVLSFGLTAAVVAGVFGI